MGYQCESRAFGFLAVLFLSQPFLDARAAQGNFLCQLMEDSVANGPRGRLDLKNSMVVKRLTPAEEAADKKLTDDLTAVEKQSVTDSKELATKTRRLEELERSTTRTKAEDAEMKRLKEDLTFDYVVMGRGHNGIISIRELLETHKKANPGGPPPKIAIVGTEPNFWARLGFSIAIVGNMDHFFETNGGKYIMDAPFSQDYLRRHNGQTPGHFLGKWINDHLAGWQKSDSPVQVLTGNFDGVADGASVFNTADGKLKLFTRTNEGLILAPGLGKPLEIAITDLTPGGAKNSGQLRHEIDGFRIVYNNVDAQDSIAKGVRSGRPAEKMIEADNVRADQQGQSEVVYLVSGNGDGAFSVLEGLLEGTFHSCCKDLATWQEQADAFSAAMGKVRIVWAGKDSLDHGWLASLSIPRYEKIRGLIEMLHVKGKIEKLEAYVGETKFRGTDQKTPFLVSVGDKYKDLPVARIFHNNGNSGPVPFLQNFYRTANRGAEPPPGPAILRELNFRPIYDNPKDPNHVVGIDILDNSGKLMGHMTGTGGVVMTMMLRKALMQTPDVKDGFFLATAAEKDRFLLAAGRMDQRMLHLPSWQNGTAVRDFNPFAQDTSGGKERTREDFRNPAGVDESTFLTRKSAQAIAARQLGR